MFVSSATLHGLLLWLSDSEGLYRGFRLYLLLSIALLLTASQGSGACGGAQSGRRGLGRGAKGGVWSLRAAGRKVMNPGGGGAARGGGVIPMYMSGQGGGLGAGGGGGGGRGGSRRAKHSD